jgi:hypothetical protein
MTFFGLISCGVCVAFGVFYKYRKYMKLKRFYRNKKWSSIIHDVILQNPHIPTVDDIRRFGYSHYFREFTTEYYYADFYNSISKKDNEKGYVYYDIEGIEFYGFRIERFMKFNNIKPQGLFYKESTDENIHVFYQLNDGYFEFSGDGSDSMSLFQITEEQYLEMKISQKNV